MRQLLIRWSNGLSYGVLGGTAQLDPSTIAVPMQTTMASMKATFVKNHKPGCDSLRAINQPATRHRVASPSRRAGKFQRLTSAQNVAVAMRISQNP